MLRPYGYPTDSLLLPGGALSLQVRSTVEYAYTLIDLPGFCLPLTVHLSRITNFLYVFRKEKSGKITKKYLVFIVIISYKIVFITANE